jgi:signal transduction histidine kinase
LSNQRQRLGQIGGSVELVSAPGQGTRTIFRLQLPGPAK